MVLPFKLVSADSHVVEPVGLWAERLAPCFADRAPRIVEYENSDWFFIDCSKPLDPTRRGVGLGLMATRRKYENPDNYDFGMEGRWADIPESAFDPAARVAELDREHIEGELLYPTFGLGMFGLKDTAYRFALIQAYNSWLAEFCKAAPDRLFGIAIIGSGDVERDVAELERCAAMGLRGAMIAIGHKDGSQWSDPRYEPLWAAAAALAMPVSLHVAASETPFHATGNVWADFACVFTPTMYTVVSMIFSGLFDRHRGLKAVSVENDASWALAVLERMDDRWLHDKHWARGDAMSSGRRPSEIFRDHVGLSFMRDRTAVLNREIIGEGNLMWGSDFPHFDGAWPGSGEVLARQFKGVPLADQERIGRGNAVAFYGLGI